MFQNKVNAKKIGYFFHMISNNKNKHFHLISVKMGRFNDLSLWSTAQERDASIFVSFLFTLSYYTQYQDEST